MIKTSEFLAVFREPDEPVHLRAFKPKAAPDTAQNRPEKWITTLDDLAGNRSFQEELRAKNQHCGIYFVVNSGGDTDSEIKRFTSWFVENDSIPLEDQHRRLDAAPLQPSIRVETRKSVHSYLLVKGNCSEAEWRDIQLRVIAYFDGDPKNKNPSRVMRLPNFDHLHINGTSLERKRITIHTFDATLHCGGDERGFPCTSA